MARKSPKPAKDPVAAILAKPSARSGLYLATARAAGLTWPAILLATGAKSAIPLRVVLRRYLATDAGQKVAPGEAAKVASLDATPSAVVAARDERGEGFPLIAARTGLSVPAVRDLYAKGGGLSADGRVYVAASGERTLVLRPGESAPVESAKSAKRARKADKAAKRERKAAKVAKRAKRAERARKAA